ncbi:MAG: FIST N-terminal domain-containing protein [bacterium]
MLRAGVGKSTLRESRAAGRQAAELARAGLPAGVPLFCWVFATAAYDHAALLAAVREAAPGARIAGCSGEGVIAGSDSEEREQAVAVLAIASDVLTCHPFLIGGYGEDSAGAGRRLAAAVTAVGAANPLGLFVFPDGLVGNCTEFLDALSETLPPSLPVVGGAAGDAMAFERTYQFVDDQVLSGGVAAILLSGEAHLELAVSHGCSPIGLELSVTRAAGGWLHEIDGRPAWTVFKDYLDGDPQDLNAEGVIHLSLADRVAEGDVEDGAEERDPFVIRTPLGLDKSTHALFFPGGGLDTGRKVRIARRDPDRIRESAERCARRILDRGRGRTPVLVLQFDCAGRGRVLFGGCAADQIVRPLQSVLGTTVPWVGFHCFGEIAPVAGKPRYQNYTVALCALFDVD